MKRTTKAFTLIELLVVIAIIALLIGILLPALSSARDSARDVVCKVTMKNLAILNLMYANDNQEYYSSPVNVGSKYLGRIVIPGEGSFTGGQALEGNTSSTTPTSSQDWISPIAGDSAALSSNRAERHQGMFDTLGCAKATVFANKPYDVGSLPGDYDDFEQIVQEGIKQVSYLMPTGFAHVGQADDNYVKSLVQRASGDGIHVSPDVRSMLVHAQDPQPKKGYRHRMDRIGTSISGKIMFADGTRYWEDDGGLDFDPATTPSLFGSFTSSSPIFQQSVAYGRESSQNAREQGINLDLSFRHNEKLNVAKFDGSVATMDNRTAWEDPNPWYPTGTLWGGSGNTPESEAFMEKQANGRSSVRIY